MIKKPMRQFLLLLMILLSASCAKTIPSTDGSAEANAAKNVVERTFGKFPRNVRFEVVNASSDGLPRYTQNVVNGCLTVKGSSSVAICKGFYDYIIEKGYGIASWTGNRLNLPRRLPDLAENEVVSPYRYHLFDNACTFGYTYPFWKWDQWEKEIDWMALHGFDMPLSPIGSETILSRVFKELGLTDKEVKDFFTGPAHLPWMRMGEMDHHAGGMSDEWFAAQLDLAHKINQRHKELGMTPVYQGFAGFVPDAFSGYFPEADITETIWSRLEDEDHNHFLSPLDPLFSRIQKEYITEWEKEFGKGEFYMIDSFNELKVPFGPLGSEERSKNLRIYSEHLYKSLANASPDATWVLQGWMFGYQRKTEWDPASVEALLSGAPDDKLIVIDLAVDFNEYVWKSEKSWDYLDGFYGKKWIWSTTPNFGGRTALVGPLDFLLNNHLIALNSPVKGNLCGFGTSPEGVENNEVNYELISHAGWSSSHTDIDMFLENYSRARYGTCPEGIKTFWKEMLQSQYGNFTNNARFRWQRRPRFNVARTTNINEHYFKAIEAFLSEKDTFKGNKLYETDAIGYAALYLAARADDVLDSIHEDLDAMNFEAAATKKAHLEEILTNADRLLESHPLWRTQRWIDLARDAAFSPEEADRFELEAKEIISVWAGQSLYDYSCRIWSGIIRDYYIPRLNYYIDTVIAGDTPNMAAFDNADFPVHKGLSPISPFKNPLEEAFNLIKSFSDGTRDNL